MVALLKILARVNPRIHAQLTDRPEASALARKITEIRPTRQRCVLFWCSSAGELEQARPLIDRLSSSPEYWTYTLLFSKSGFDYARKTGLTSAYSLAPATDSIWDWGLVFAALRPSLTVVVRHELWPGFIETAFHYGALVLVNCSRSLGEGRSWIKRIVKKWLLRRFSRIYTVAGTDRSWVITTYQLDPSAVLETGDTKYDRVFERSADQSRRASLPPGLRAQPGSRKILVFGSAHPPDLDLILQSERACALIKEHWQVIVAPHHIEPAKIEWFRRRLTAAGFSPVLFTGYTQADISHIQPPTCMILDTMGMLAELYGIANAAFVGGASHYQVHNVLEPACRGLAIAHGPFYKNSSEAVTLVEKGISHVIGTPGDFCAWLDALDTSPASRADRITTVAAFCGAADRITSDWKHLLNG